MNAPQKPGWLARVLLSVTTVAFVIAGFFFLTVVLIVGTLLALIIGVRVWWTLRKLKQMHPSMSPTQGNNPDGAATDVLDGEYQVIERESSAPRVSRSPQSPSLRQ